MKKYVYFLMMLALALPPASALAEEFALHSGVKFGMTMDEVKKTEREAGFEASAESWNAYFRYNCPEDHQETGVLVSGEIAGVDGAGILYHFSKDNSLSSAVYLLGMSDSGGDYAPIREDLIRRYGEPDEGSAEMWHSYLPMDVYSWLDYISDKDGKDLFFNHNDAWLILNDDGSYVIITGCECRYELPYTDKRYYTFVGYQRFAGEEIEDALEAAQKRMDTMESGA